MKNFFASSTLKSILIFSITFFISIYLLIFFLKISEYRSDNNKMFITGLKFIFAENANKNDLKTFFAKVDDYVKSCSYDVFLDINNELVYSGNKTVSPETDLSDYSFVEIAFKKINIGVFYNYSRGFSGLFLYPLLIIPFIAIVIFLFYKINQFEKAKENNDLMLSMSKEAAHQMGTPITSLKGWLELVKDEVSLNKDLNYSSVPAFIEGMGSDLERIEYVLECFSKLSDKIKKDVVNLDILVNEVTTYLKQRLPQNSSKFEINTIIDWKGDLLLDRILIYWSLENIIKNALDSIPFDRKGIVTIKVYDEKENILIDIEDNGSGISQKNRKKIFEPGFTTKKRGWGIGLSLVKRVITENHRGKVFVKSSVPGKGSVFRIELAKNQYT